MLQHGSEVPGLGGLGRAPGRGAPGVTPVVTVLGMHRSGTSLCANMLQAMGLDMAASAGPSPNNQRGHWERARINDLNDQVFAVFGRNWGDTSHLLALPPCWLDDPRVCAVRGLLIDLLRPQIASRRFGFKDPRTARLLPMWRQVFDALNVRPRFVFCVRDPAQVTRSLTERDRMARGHSEYRWLIYNAEAVAGVGGDPVCIVPYEDWFARPMEVADRLAAFVSMPAPSAMTVQSLVDPALRHDAASQAPAQSLAVRLHTRIANSAGAGRFDADLVALCGCLEEFEHQVQPLLVDTEVLRASVAEQNRVIADLTAALRQARQAAMA